MVRVSLTPAPNIEAFCRGLTGSRSDSEGQNIVIELCYARKERRDRVPSLLAELVQLEGRCPYPPGTTLRSATAKEATKTISIVMVINQDPVASGLVGQLGSPRRKYHRGLAD